MGFFDDDEELQNAETDPFAIPDGKDTPVYVEKSEVVTIKDTGEKVWVVTFREAKEIGGKPSTRRYQEWLKHPKYVEKETQKAYRRGHNKEVLMALGVPKQGLNQAEPGDLLGLQGLLSLFTRRGYKTFGGFKVTESGGNGDGMVTGAPMISTDDLASVGATSNSDADFFS